MAIEVGDVTVTVTVSERSWRMEVFADYGVDPLIRFHRERIGVQEDGAVASRAVLPVIERKLSAVVDQTVGGVTGQQLADLLSAWGDEWAAEDMVAAAEAAAAAANAGKTQGKT